MKINRILAGVLARIGFWIPDVPYLKLRYRLFTGHTLNFDNPIGFNEKLNWLKVFYKNPILPSLVDKIDVKKRIASIIGNEMIIPTLGVWDNFDEIDFESLPDEFVLKTSNGAGGTGVFICRDKSKIDKIKLKTQLEQSSRTNWLIGREWVYYNLKKRYVAEKLLKNSDGSDIVDYKIFCFNGEPQLLFVASDRYLGKDTLKFDWYDKDLNHLPFKSYGYENSNKCLNGLEKWEEMKSVARKIATQLTLPQVRVDLYLIDGKIYFGELTFFHDQGTVALVPWEWEKKIGDMIKLPNKWV